MTNKLFFALVAAAALAGCNKASHTITAGGPDQGNTAEIPQNVVLPPTIASSKSYRCTNNKVVYIDWMSDGTAHAKDTQEGVAAPVDPADLKGDPKGGSITYKGQSCKA